MPTPRLTRMQALETVNAIKNCGGSRVEATLRLGLGHATFGRRLAAIKTLYPDIEIPPGARGGHPKVERTLAEEVEHTRAKESERLTKARLKEALAEISALNEKISELEWAHNVSLKPSEWLLDSRIPKGKSPHIPLIFFSDAQAGEVVRANEVDTPWDYNSDIFRQRYRKMISVAIDLAMNHGGRKWTYPGCCYLRGGDNISGGLHEDLRELGEDATPIQQVELVAEEEAAGIRHLADTFGKVEVQTPGAAGNHDRTTRFPPTKLAWARSYDRLVHKLLVQEFKKDKRVAFHISKSPDIRFNVFDKRMLCSHGDKIGSRGGMGFVGPGATILRGWQKLLLEQTRLGYIVDMVFTGHHHWPFDVPFKGISNGSFTGTTEFGKQFRMEPIAPLQYLAFFHPKYGCVDVRHLYLA